MATVLTNALRHDCDSSIIRRLAVAAFVVSMSSSCAHALERAPAHTGRFHVEVVAHTIIIRSPQAPDGETCILGSGSDRVLRRLRDRSDDADVTLTYERLPRPEFHTSGGAFPPDRYAIVRGQMLAPWCDSDELYWVTSFRPSQ